MSAADLLALYRVALQYYKEGKTQEEISQTENISRSQVSRMLDKARAQGIVRFEVTLPCEPDVEALEEFLMQKLKLGQVILAPAEEGWTGSRTAGAIAAAAAAELPRMLKGASSVGLGWGETMYRMAHSLQSRITLPDCMFIPLIGASSSMNPFLQINTIIDSVADRLRGDSFFTNLPAFRERNMPLTAYEKKRLRTLYECWDDLDAAVFGLGAVDAVFRTFDEEVTESSRAHIVSAGAAGEILSQYYFADGSLLPQDDSYVIHAFPLAKLKAVPRTICISGGLQKAGAILAAARAGYFRTLITDTVTARELYNRLRREMIQ